VLLCKHLELERPEDAIRTYREVFPGERLHSRARALLDSLFQDQGAGFER